MKKAIGCIVFLFAAILSLTACGNLIRPLDGNMLNNLAAKKLAESDSYTATSSVDVKFLIDGTKIEVASDAVKSVSGQSSRDLTIITETEQMITYKSSNSKNDATEKI